MTLQCVVSKCALVVPETGQPSTDRLIKGTLSLYLLFECHTRTNLGGYCDVPNCLQVLDCASLSGAFGRANRGRKRQGTGALHNAVAPPKGMAITHEPTSNNPLTRLRNKSRFS